MRALRLLVGLVATLALGVGAAQAQNTADLTYVNLSAPGEPICFGDDIRYTATLAGPDYFGGIKWFYKWKGCDPDRPEERLLDTNGLPIGSLNTQGREELLGEFDIRVEVTFVKGTGGSYVVNSTKTLSVLPPDTAALANPQVLGVPVEAYDPFQGPNLQVVFDVKKGNRILANCGGIALESLARAKYGRGPERSMGPAPGLTSTAGAILDAKGVVADAGFASAPNGYVLDEFDQTLGLRLPKGCGGTEDISLAPSFHFKMIKDDFFHWKLMMP